jgi:hypothetical protein
MRARVARIALFLLGLAALWGVCLYAHGGHERLFKYSAHLAHKFTARAMMDRTLAMDPTLFGVTMNDEQVYNGAGFTNWGFGVPLLQIPFHAMVPLLGSRVTSRYFPDRLIFFMYLAALVPVLWTALVRASLSETGLRRPAALSTWWCGWSATLVALACAVFPLLSYRFIVYEETIAYFALAELYALAFYIRFVQSKNLFWLAATAIAASMGLLIRPTGIPYLGLWGALCALSDRRWRTAALYCGAAAPLVTFWLCSNWVRSGSAWSWGYQNALPEYSFHYAMQRFGYRCEEVRSSFWTSVKWLFECFFLRIPDPTPDQYKCHYLFEMRAPGNAPYFPPTVFVILCGSLFYHALRKRALAYYVPHATFVAMFFAYAKGGIGFAYRYTSDFWPLIVLILVHLAPAARLEERKQLGLAAGLAFVFYGVVAYFQDLAPYFHTLAVMDGAQMAAADEVHDRVNSEPHPMLPTHISCGEPLPSWPRANGRGWGRLCDVDMVTNLFLGVRKRTDTVYHLRFKVDHAASPSLRILVNSKYYEAHLEEDGEYVAEFVLKYARLRSPGVMITVEWSREDVMPPLKLLEMELG